MTKKIKLNEIDNVMAESVQKLVRVTTLEWSARVLKATPVDTGRLRMAWQTDISKPYIGTISNNVEYAEPVAYGQNLPPSWGGEYRTRQGTVKGYPEIIGKELEIWAKREYEKLKRSI
tara:strand:- start:242 stop:595 length:354 start_codon:yes stop_codon:yes gene_type:complete